MRMQLNGARIGCNACFNVLGVALMLVIDIVLFGLAGILIWVTQMVWIPF